MTSTPGTQKSTVAFTLVELLVVITILVVLLALLTPAMDQAVYQAELAVCGSNQKSVGQGVATYALSSARAYPYRLGVETVAAWRPSLITLRATGERPLVQSYCNLDALVCPLGGKIDVKRVEPRVWVHSAPQLWYGWRYAIGQRRYPGMKKLGASFESPDGGSFRILASDWTTISVLGNFVYGEHPDKDGKLWLDVANLRDSQVSLGMLLGDKITYSLWRRSGNFRRGAIDRNILYEEGAVRRYDNVTVADDGFPDERMVEVPEYNNDQEPDWHAYLPKD